MEKNMSVPVILILCLAIAACTSSPYVYRAGEFNRSLIDFAQEPEDISEVTICYSSSNTSAQEVRKLALDRCAMFGKKAVFENQNYLSCPLSTPVAAQYSCVTP
jgi:hypothetical protein